jgi:uncharacterized protein (DUF697 family)/tellurite resistance protein
MHEFRSEIRTRETDHPKAAILEGDTGMNAITPVSAKDKLKLDAIQRAAVADLAEVTAGLRVLVCLAKADGELTELDKRVLHDVLHGELHPSVETVEYLADQKIDLQAELSRIQSSDMRERTFNAAYCIAHLDGHCSPAKARMLEDIRTALKLPPERATLLGRMYSEARSAIWPDHINLLPDAAVRAAKINDEILKYSVLNAVTGAFPLPGLSIATDLLVISVQTKLVHDIGQYWGHQVDREAARSLIATIAGAAGLRIAVHSLLNFVPVLGSVVGATSAFVTTWALGKAANRYFESGGKLNGAELKKLFDESMQDARAAYDKSRDLIASKMKSRQETLKALDEDLKAGRITQEQYTNTIKGLE